MIDSDDPLHKRRRGIVDRGFHPRPIAEEERRIRETTVELIGALAAKGDCDVVRDLAGPLPMIVIGDMLGTPRENTAELQHWSDVMLSGADGPENSTQEVLEAYAAFVAMMDGIIAERKKNPGDDLISTLVRAHPDDDVLNREEIIGEALLLLIGGNETTRNVISGGIEALLRHPDQKQKLIDDPTLIPSAVEECLRWVTPVINMARTATTDVDVRGRTIPAGDQVLLMYASANRDGEVFEDPNTFDVARSPNPHVTFGYSTHHCLGASLARLEIKVMLEEVLQRLPNMRLANPDAPLTRTRSSFIRGITALPVVL